MLLLLGIWAGISLIHVLALFRIPTLSLSQALPPLLPALSAIHYLCGTACIVLVAWTSYTNYTAVQEAKNRQLYAATANSRSGDGNSSKSLADGSLYENNTDMPAARARALTPAVASACIFALLCMTIGLLTTWVAAYLDAELIVLYNNNSAWYATATQAQKNRLTESRVPAVIRCVCALFAWLAVAGVAAVVVFSDAPEVKTGNTTGGNEDPNRGGSSTLNGSVYAIGNQNSQMNQSSGYPAPTLGLQQRSLGNNVSQASARTYI